MTPQPQSHFPDLPGWVPSAAREYLAHVEEGRSMRELSRAGGCHPSTILRRIRAFEARRDDPLVDEALRRLGARAQICPEPGAIEMMQDTRAQMSAPDDAMLMREGPRVLRRLSESGACLAIADQMEKAVVVRDGIDGQSLRTAVVERPLAEAMALKGWIAGNSAGRVTRYKITQAGRAALKALVEAGDTARVGFAEMQSGFAPAPGVDARRDAAQAMRSVRPVQAESPLLLLARRRDKDGQPFLSDALVAAGERLREDFELAQLGPQVAQNWERFLTSGVDGRRPTSGSGDTARERVEAALAELGPGLGDVALRCCCYLEGMETAERRMGWSARSGKIVLKIALERLKRHYDAQSDGWSPMIG